MAFSDWAFGVLKRTDSVSLSTWARLLLDYLSGPCGLDPESVRADLRSDFESAGRKEVPPFLRGEEAATARARTSERLSRRQQRHGG